MARRPPPPPPRKKKRDTKRRLSRLVDEERPFEPGVAPESYARPHHFAVNADVFDLDAEGIALPGNVIRLLGEYAQGHGPAKALYVKATDHELVAPHEITMAVAELQRQNEKLNSGELDKLIRELQQQITHGTEEGEERLSFDLSEKEEESLRHISRKYQSAEILYDAYDASELTIPRDEVVRAFFATASDGGDLGTVPLVEGTLKKKIGQLWEDAEAFEEWERAEQEGWHEEDQD